MVTFQRKAKIISSSAHFESGIINLRQRIWISYVSSNRKRIAATLGQMLRFNAVKTKWRSDGFVRHSKTNEPPLSVRVGLMVHSNTKKKSLVENLTNERLTI